MDNERSDTKPKPIEIEDAEQFEEQALMEEPEVEPSAEQRLLELEQQLVSKHEDYLRAVADLQNFRRRSAEERVQQLQYANQQLILELLPVLDNFDRAMECSLDGETAQSFLRGVCMVRDQLHEVMGRFGLSPIPAQGALFDPALHEAVERVVTTDVCEGTIVEEVLPGYSFNGRVIRAAKVKVAVEPHD